MSKSTLHSAVQNLEEKADNYQEATNFEATLNEYTGEASSAQTSVYGLKNRLEEMERLNDIYTEVFGEPTPPVVEDARDRARQVLDRTPQDYWTIIDDGQGDQYEKKVQTAKSKVDEARQSLRDSLNDKQSTWVERVDTGRRILALMSESHDTESLLSDIEQFVTNEMWDDSKPVTTLQADWQGIQRKLDKGTVADWDEFQADHKLSDATIESLKRLAEGESLSFNEVDPSVMDELMGVDDLRDVLEVTL